MESKNHNQGTKEQVSFWALMISITIILFLSFPFSLAFADDDNQQFSKSYEGGNGSGFSGGRNNNIANVLTKAMFETLLPHHNDPKCPASKGFYSYSHFLKAAEQYYPNFGTTGDIPTRKRDLAAFFAITSYETTGKWDNVSDPDTYNWGYCSLTGNTSCDCCLPAWEKKYPCVPGKKYYGRGPLKLFWNKNYGAAGEALGVDLLSNPEIVEKDPVISFATAIWYWMTSHDGMPSPHDVITGLWKPSMADIEAGRLPGFGLVSNLIYNVTDCYGWHKDMRTRFYLRHCRLFNVHPGDNVQCNPKQKPFGFWANLTNRVKTM